jgi:4-amino-4-deoxy-L-arabinose transferase-like glycosyltransferase
MWSKPAHSLKEDWLIYLLLASFFIALYMPNLGDHGLFDPWETHYGEVARNMVERSNYIDPFWGSPWDIDGVKRERNGFYSKPPLTMWLMAVGMQIMGDNAWGVRLLFPLLAIAALLSIYLALSRLINRRTGLFASLMCGLSPFYIFVSHQAVTDSPLVSLIIIGMMSLSLGLFDPRADDQASGVLQGFTMMLLTLVVLGQLWVIWPMDRSPDAIYQSPYQAWFLNLQWNLREYAIVAKGKGWILALLLAPLCLYIIHRVRQLKQRRSFYFVIFYICCGLTVCAKGWLGWAPMGGALFCYLLLMGAWHWLGRAHMGLGLGLVLITGHIWVLAMLGGHHPQWMVRFIQHDHLNRLFMGVHSTDDGAFEYFFQWIGYGLFPWIAILPASIAHSLSRLQILPKDQAHTKLNDSSNRAACFELLIFLWAILGLFLFSKSSTKFHHYIFPILPAFCILMSLFLNRLWQKQIQRHTLWMCTAMAVLVWVGQDVVRPSAAAGQGSQNWVNMFTYKYDRAWPIPPSQQGLEGLQKSAVSTAWRKELYIPLTLTEQIPYSKALQKAVEDQVWTTRFSQPVYWAMILAFLALLAMTLPIAWSKFLGIPALLVSAGYLSYFFIATYLPGIAIHWSQWELWDHYYQDCQVYAPEEKADFQRHLLQISSRIPSQIDRFPRAWCKEPLVAFRMNWRGETFYSSNTTIPVLYSKDFKPFLKSWGIWDQWQTGKEFYMFTERNRIKTELEKSLPSHLKGQYKEIFGEGRKFVLLKFHEPITKVKHK